MESMSFGYYLEEWRAIPGYATFYEVSSHGRVRSLDHHDSRGRFHRGTIKKITVTTNGRYRRLAVCIVREGKSKATMSYVSSLVAAAFLGDRPRGFFVRHGPAGSMCDHKDNLYYAAHRRSPVLTKEEVVVIRQMLATGEYTQAEIGRHFGVSTFAISNIARRRSWKHVNLPTASSPNSQSA